MGRVINIDWHEVSKIADEYYEEAENLRTIIEETKTSFESISTSWSGIDSNNFIYNSKSVITNLTNEYNYMLEWAKYLLKASLRYSDNVEEAKQRISIIDDILNGNNENEEW